MEIVSIVSSIVAMILALIAIALSLYFYTQSKNTESNVTNALESIKAQTSTLERLSGRHMDRLIKGVTEVRAPEESVTSLLITMIKEMPTSITSQLQVPSASATNQALINEAITCYIATYYYAAITNVTIQSYLPPLSDLKSDDPYKGMVDRTYSDVLLLQGILDRVDTGALTANALYHIYTEASTTWKPLVKDSTTVYKDRKVATE